MEANCEHIFFELSTKQWRTLEGDCRGEVRDYMVEPDEGELRALRAAYGGKRTIGFSRSFCEAHFQTFCTVHPDWKITPRVLNDRDTITYLTRGRGSRRYIVELGSVKLGDKFVFRFEEILGPEYANRGKPPFEGQVLTVIGFHPRLKNNVEVLAPDGVTSLMPLDMVVKAIRLSARSG